MKSFLLKTLCFISVFCMIAFNVKADIVAYDANGQYLGIVMDYGTGSWNDELRLFMPTFNAFYEIGVDSLSDSKDFGVEEGQATMYYETNDCSGVAYFNISFLAEDVDATSFIEKYGDQTYKKDFSNSKKFIALSYQWYDSISSELGDCEQLIDGESETYYALITVEMPFKEPIVWPLKFEHSSLDINGDGKTGLEEAIFSLRTVSGLEGD